MYEMSKSAFFRALPEELNICIGDYLCGTQEQWRIVFKESLKFIGLGRLCEHYCNKLGRHKIFHTSLCDRECFNIVGCRLRLDFDFDDEDYDYDPPSDDDEDYDYDPPSDDDEDYDLLV
jgi:hypothetical protein